MAIANYNEQKPFIIFTFWKLCNGEQRLAVQHKLYLAISSLICTQKSVVKQLVTYRK